MADVFIAAAPGEDAQARGLAEALAILGFDAVAGEPGEADLAEKADSAKCVLVLWSRAAVGAPWLTALAVLALERKKLVSTEFEADATPAPFRAAPRAPLLARDRAGFKARFQALIVELDKLTPTKGDPAALPDALIKARAALLRPTQSVGARPWKTLGSFALAVAALFAIGFGAGRVLNATRSGALLVATTTADAASTASAAVDGPPYGVTPRDLERQPWRASAAQINPDAAGRIRADATRGDARAHALACLGHLAGAPGFLPSPSAAREHCDAAAAQNDPAGLYLSWVLRRTAPQSAIDEATARTRLAQAAERGWISAQIDYAQTLAPDARAPLAAQTEAGRWWLAAAESGDARGQYFYARWLRDSAAGPRDPSAAIPFLERAAAQGQLDAAHMLATLYRDGIGAPRNVARARTLYEQAADGGHTPSMFNLADMMRDGSNADRARAITLYRALACMPDERQIRPLALQRLRALHESAACR